MGSSLGSMYEMLGLAVVDNKKYQKHLEIRKNLICLSESSMVWKKKWQRYLEQDCRLLRLQDEGSGCRLK